MFKGRKMGYALLGGLIFALLGAGYFLNEAGRSPSGGDLAAFREKPYFKNGKFVNAKPVAYDYFGDCEDKMTIANILPFLFGKGHAPEKPLPVVALTADSFPAAPEELALYWLGHSSSILEIGGYRIGTDLVFGNASPVPFTVKRYQPAPLKRDDLPPLDYVLLTHNHYDHLEKSTVQAVKNAVFIVPAGLSATLKGWGVSGDRIIELGWGDVFERDGLKITAVEGVHFSGRKLWDADKTLWNSYVVSAKGKNVFMGGDSGYSPHFSRIGEKYGPFDFAALEIDAWNGGWPDIHLFPEQSVRAAKDLKAERMVPIHWGVFDLGNHMWNKSIERVAEIARREGMTLDSPRQGEKYTPGKTAVTQWWNNETGE